MSRSLASQARLRCRSRRGLATVGIGTGVANPMMGVNLFRIAPHSTQAQAFATSSWTLNLGIDICAIVGGTMLDDLAPRRFGRPFLLKGCGLAR